MVSLAEPRADDHRRDGRMIERPARRHIGDRDAVLLRDRVERAEDRLECAPAAGGVDEALVFHLAPVGDLIARRLRPAEPALGHQAAGERAVGEQPNAVLEAEGAHLARRAAIEEREAHLIADDGNAVLHQHAQVGRVEIGDAEMADEPFAAQRVETLHRVEIGGVLERPPMELQQIDRLDAEPLAAALDAFAHDLGRHRPGVGHHLVKAAGRVGPAASPPATRERKRPAMSSALP